MRALGPERVAELLLSLGPKGLFEAPTSTSSDKDLCELGCAVIDSAIFRAWQRIEAHRAGSHLGNDASGAYVELFTIEHIRGLYSGTVSTVLPDFGDVGEELSLQLHRLLWLIAGPYYYACCINYVESSIVVEFTQLRTDVYGGLVQIAEGIHAACWCVRRVRKMFNKTGTGHMFVVRHAVLCLQASQNRRCQKSAGRKKVDETGASPAEKPTAQSPKADTIVERSVAQELEQDVITSRILSSQQEDCDDKIAEEIAEQNKAAADARRARRRGGNLGSELQTPEGVAALAVEALNDEPSRRQTRRHEKRMKEKKRREAQDAKRAAREKATFLRDTRGWENARPIEETACPQKPPANPRKKADEATKKREAEERKIARALFK